MAIEENNIITYKDLIDNTLDTIENMCCNINGLKNNIPDDVKPGVIQDIGIKDYCYVRLELKDNKRLITSSSGSSINIVQSQTVRKQLTDFLTRRGISQDTGVVITSKGIINFFNNVSIFINARTITVPSIQQKTVCTFYISSDQVTPLNSPYTFSDDNIEDQSGNIKQLSYDDVNKTISNINDCFSKVNKDVYTSLQVVCSSCSSSSSSSCSSSSSSSYIVYMII